MKVNLNFSFFSLVQVLATVVSLINAETKIIGGEVVTPHSEPHILSLKGTGPGTHFCGATIMSTTHAISAAHCYRRYFTQEFQS